MKKAVLSLLITVAVNANVLAQDNFYPDPLVFNGKVKEVKGYIVQESGDEIGAINPSFFTVSYDYNKGVRTIKTFDLIKKLHEWLSYEQKLDDNSRRFIFPSIVSLIRLDEYAVSYDNKGNKRESLKGWTVSEESVYTYDKQGRVIITTAYTNGKLGSSRSLKYNADKTVTIELRDAKGKATAESTQTKDEHGNTIKDVYKNLNDNEGYHTNSLTYKYDEHGNFTSFTYCWDGKPQWSLRRDITYAE